MSHRLLSLNIALGQILMSDPELAAGMQNPKVMEAFQNLMSQPGGAAGLMSNPAKLQELMSDPEVGPFLQKLMAKLGGGAMGGMPGGGGPGPASGGGDDDIDLGDLPDLE
jgi:suppressor of tumorigenicity protein 13